MLKLAGTGFNSCALILRGYHYKSQDRLGYFLNACEFIPSYIFNIIKPLYKKFKELDVFIVTFPSPVETQIIDAYKPIDFFIDYKNECKDQQTTFLKGISLIKKKYDKYVFIRLDLSFKKSINNWNIWLKEPNIYLPWKHIWPIMETNWSWETEKPVNDAIHVMDYGFLEKFKNAIARHRENFHFIYNDLPTRHVKFICNGFYHANTTEKHHYACNPLYIIGNRPYHHVCLPQ